MGASLFSKLFSQNFVFSSAKFLLKKRRKKLLHACALVGWCTICVPTNPPILTFQQVCRGSTWTLLRRTPGWSWVQSDAPVPVQTSPSAIRHGGLRPHVPFPSRFSFKFILDWIKLKLDENPAIDESIHDSQKCLSFIVYASTCYLWNLHNRITWSLFIDPHDIMKCETCSFQFKVLEICF